MLKAEKKAKAVGPQRVVVLWGPSLRGRTARNWNGAGRASKVRARPRGREEYTRLMRKEDSAERHHQSPLIAASRRTLQCLPYQRSVDR
jgi:hypothetical protein